MRGRRKPKPGDSPSSFQRGCCQPGLEPPYQGRQVCCNTDIPSNRTRGCKTAPLCTLPHESRWQQTPSQQPSWQFSFKMQLSLDNKYIHNQNRWVKAYPLGGGTCCHALHRPWDYERDLTAEPRKLWFHKRLIRNFSPASLFSPDISRL